MYFISSGKVHLNAVASVDSDLSFPLAVFYAMHRLERRLEDAAWEKLVELIGWIFSSGESCKNLSFYLTFPHLYIQIISFVYISSRRKYSSLVEGVQVFSRLCLYVSIKCVSLHYKILNFWYCLLARCLQHGRGRDCSLGRLIVEWYNFEISRHRDKLNPYKLWDNPFMHIIVLKVVLEL